MKARILLAPLLLLLPALALADEKASPPAQDTQIFVYRMSEQDMQKFLRGIRPDPVSPDAFRIAMNWDLGRSLIRIAAPRVSRKNASRDTQKRTILDCSQADKPVDKDLLT